MLHLVSSMPIQHNLLDTKVNTAAFFSSMPDSWVLLKLHINKKAAIIASLKRVFPGPSSAVLYHVV
jgi:hypothetical protein